MKELHEIYPDVDIQKLILEAIEQGRLDEDKYLNPEPFLQALCTGEVKLGKTYGGMITPYHIAILVKEDDKALELIEKIGKRTYV